MLKAFFAVSIYAQWLGLPLAMAQTAPPAAEPGPTIRTTAAEVLLDLTVLDRHGKPVKNLKRGDIEIYEDGVRQQLTSFRLVGTREAGPRPEGAVSGQGSFSPRALRQVNLVCIVFHNLDPVYRKFAGEAVQEFLKGDFPPETYIGLFLLDDRLTPVHPFTKDRQELIRAAANPFTLRALDFAVASEAVLTANPSQVTIDTTVDMVAHTANTIMRGSGGEISNTTVAGAEVNTGAGANALRGNRVIERRDFSNITGMRETDRIVTMVNQLGGLPGRKSILLVSGGLLTTGDPERFQSILNRATQMGVTVYALDPAGLRENSTSHAADVALGQVASVSRTQTNTDTSNLSAAKEKSRQGDTMNDAVRASDTQAALRDLAEGTGGFLIANTNEFKKPFQHIVEDLDAHYETSYRPTSDKYDGHLRKIEVKLARSDLHVESRTGYFAMPELKGGSQLLPFETVSLALLNTKPPPHAFDFGTAAFLFRNDGAAAQGELVFEVPGTTLTANSNPERHMNAVHVSLFALVKDAAGQVVDKFSVDSPFEIPDANLATVRATPLINTHPISLPPGKYSVETVVVDREGGRASSSVAQFETPEARKTVSLSSVVLLQRIEPATGPSEASDPLVFQSKRLIPFVDRKLTAEAKPYLYFVVYPDKANPEKPKVQVEFRVNGEEVAKQTADLPAVDASGAIPMIIRAATHPGNCELSITALQGSKSATQKIAYTVATK